MIQLTDQQLKDIAGELETGMKCYLHRQTGELISFPNPDQFLDADFEAWQEKIDKVEESPDDYLEISPLSSREDFQIMEQFVEQKTTGQVQSRLNNALRQSKPFRAFKQQIDNSGDYRQAWFEFRDQQMVEYVRALIETAD